MMNKFSRFMEYLHLCSAQLAFIMVWIMDAFNQDMVTITSPILQTSDLIEQRTGLAVGVQFRTELETILQSQARGDLVGYLETLRASKETAPVWQNLINALTIGETYFMRDQAHFNLLRSPILTELIARRRQENQLHLNVWSAGCASGEEAYSLAITIYETLPDLANWTVRIIGSDLNAHALHIARRAVYRKWAFRHTDIDFQNRYFDPTADGLQIKPAIREMVTFRHANILHGAPLPQIDVIFCRNVMLYFGDAQTRRVENLLFDVLAPGGWLLLGQAETLCHNRERWLTHLFPGAPVYQKSLKSGLIKSGEFPYQQYEALPPIQSTISRLQLTHGDAVQAIQQEEYERAEHLLVDLLHIIPNNAPTHTLLACVFANRNLIQEAHAQLDIALRLDPLLADGHYLRALLYVNEGRPLEAKKSLHATLYCQRSHPLASFVLGNLYAQDGELVKATKHWENSRRAVNNLQSDSPVSNISNTTAGQLRRMVEDQLEGWTA